jgi:hypothetical protein
MNERALLVVALLPILAACGSKAAGTDSNDAGPTCSCPTDITVACTGELTPVKLAVPTTVCGNAADAKDDAPAKGFLVGRATVTYTAVHTASCSTHVTVTDKTPPTLACSTLPAQILSTPGGSVVPPTPAATDLCSSKVTVTAEPATLTATAAVTYTATDASGNKSACKTTVTVENGFPAVGLRLAHAAIETSGATSAIVLWDTPSGSDVDTYRVERGPAMTGPWTTLATVPVATTMYSDPSIGGMVAYYRVVSTVKGAVGGATDPIRVLAITASQYNLGVEPVPGLDMPANAAAGTPETMSVPIDGYVRYPTNLTSGPYPLALLLHGNHGNCRPPDWDSTGTNPNLDDDCVISNTNACPAGYTPTPNAEGLLSLGETLSARGYVVASVDANAINCREDTTDGGYIGARSELLIQHLRQWEIWATAGAAPFGSMFAAHVDMGHVVLFGHSRGAEAVAEVPQTFATAPNVAGITLAAVFALAPTNFDDPQPGSLPYGTLVPTCDGDVFTYTGVQLYDRRFLVGAAKGSGVQFFMNHADHDHFNTEWVFDDNGLYGILTCDEGQVDVAAMQPRVLEVLVGTWVDSIVPAGAALEPWMHAVGDVPPSIAAYAGGTFPLDLRRSYTSTSVMEIDNFESGSLTEDLLGGAYSSMGGFADGTPAVCTGISSAPCNPVYMADYGGSGVTFGWPHYNELAPPPQRSAVALDWSSGTGVLVANLAAGSGTFDASAYAALSLRVASRPATTNTDAIGGAVDLEIAIVDASGHRASSLASAVATVPNLYTSAYPRAVLQTVRLALPGLASSSTPAVDLKNLTSIELATAAPGQTTGSVLVTDVEFAQ